jgi:hypothetical protein
LICILKEYQINMKKNALIFHLCKILFQKNKEFFETYYPRVSLVCILRCFYFDLKRVKNQNSVFCSIRNREKQFRALQKEAEIANLEAEPLGILLIKKSGKYFSYNLK